MSLAFRLCMFALLWLTAGVANAQPYEVSATLSSHQVEVGEPFRIELSAMVSDGGSPTEPHVNSPSGLRVTGPNIGTRTSMQFGGGQSTVRRGISATWSAVADKPGSYVIPPPSVVIQGRRVMARETLRVLVMPSTGKRRRSKTGRWSFGGSFSPFDNMFNEPEAAPLTVDDLSAAARRLALSKAPAALAFVRLIPSAKRAVVGEQVTLSYYLYYRPGSVSRMTEQREPSLSDFFRRRIGKDPGTVEELWTLVGGQRYQVRLLERVALFPLRAGRLHTGKLSVKLLRRRRELARESNDVVLSVREPPARGRPAGYRLGDVGRYRLKATVEPRTAPAGDVVAVTVRLRGVGNLPQQLMVPQRSDLEWLEPEKKEHIEEQRGGRLGGWRSFGYVVRLRSEGLQDLGEVKLPYYDPRARRYRVAKVALGKVKVTQAVSANASTTAGSAAAASEGPPDPFVTVAPIRTEFVPFEPIRDRGMAPRLFLIALAAPPVTMALFSGLWVLAGAFRRRRANINKAPETLAKSALGQAARDRDTADAARSVERAVHLAIESATGLKSRAVLLDELEERLRAMGIDADLAADALKVLRTCERARFEPGEPQAGDHAVVKAARPVVRSLLRALPELGGGS